MSTTVQVQSGPQTTVTVERPPSASVAVQSTGSTSITVSSPCVPATVVTTPQDPISVSVLSPGSVTSVTTTGIKGTTVQVGTPKDCPSPALSKQFVAGQDLALGSLVAIDSSGEAVLADLSGFDRVVGVSSGAYSTGQLATILTLQGSCVPVRFESIPDAAFNGSDVYLGNPGLARTIQSKSGVGVLVGANGISQTPLVLLDPHPSIDGVIAVELDITPTSPGAQVLYTANDGDAVCLTRIWLETPFDQAAEIEVGTLIDSNCFGFVSGPLIGS